MKAIGKYLADVVKRNPKEFRMFSPDELASNKLDDVLSVTDRNFQWDPETAHKGGRVTEILSEHTLQGWLQGYTMTGRHGVFPSYEAFLGIVASEFLLGVSAIRLEKAPTDARSSPPAMVVQYTKFLKMGLESKWRGPVAALTYIETSTWTRQGEFGRWCGEKCWTNGS